MHIDTKPSVATQTRRADAVESAQPAFTAQAQADASNQVAALRDEVDDIHVIEHIRGMVAATIGNLPTDASVAARTQAQQWGTWALNIADAMALPTTR